MGEAEDDHLSDALASWDLRLIKAALKKGGDPNSAKIGPVPVLHLAALSGNLEIVEALLKAGADVNAAGDDVDGRREGEGDRPLHFAAAAKGGDPIAVVRRLLDAGADVNASGWHGKLPLDTAARARNKDTALVLLDAGGRCSPERTDWVERVRKKKSEGRGKDL